jgi:hypothetical protein
LGIVSVHSRLCTNSGAECLLSAKSGLVAICPPNDWTEVTLPVTRCLPLNLTIR